MGESSETIPDLKQVAQEVQRISAALGMITPEEIQMATGSMFSRVGLSKDGKRMVLYPQHDITAYRDLISWTLVGRLLKQQRDPLVRNPARYDNILAVVVIACLIPFLLVTPVLNDTLSIITLAVVVGGYLLVTYRLGPKKIPYARFVSEAMLRVGNWTKEEADNHVKGARLMGIWLPLFIVIMLSSMALTLILEF